MIVADIVLLELLIYCFASRHFIEREIKISLATQK